MSETWQMRLVREHTELKERVEKLVEFSETDTFLSLPEDDRELLGTQLCAMGTYLGIMQMRLRRLELIEYKYSES